MGLLGEVGPGLAHAPLVDPGQVCQEPHVLVHSSFELILCTSPRAPRARMGLPRGEAYNHKETCLNAWFGNLSRHQGPPGRPSHGVWSNAHQATFHDPHHGLHQDCHNRDVSLWAAQLPGIEAGGGMGLGNHLHNQNHNFGPSCVRDLGCGHNHGANPHPADLGAPVSGYVDSVTRRREQCAKGVGGRLRGVVLRRTHRGPALGMGAWQLTKAKNNNAQTRNSVAHAVCTGTGRSF